MSRPAQLPPVIANSDGLEIVQRAANAVGLTVEELADLFVDNGITALPPADGISKRYTLKDLGNKLWGEMQKMHKSRRAEWFGNLSEPQQIAVIVTLRHRGFAPLAIASDFNIGETRVRRIHSEYATELGAQVIQIRLDTIAGQMQMVTEQAQHMAVEKGDHNALWRIEKEKIATLQSLGITAQAAQKIEVSHKVDDQTKEQIEKLADLRMKQRIRAEELKQIEAEVVDAPPELEDYDEDYD